jgi:hypothetical protein
VGLLGAQVADWTAKTVEKESNTAFNDLVKRATGGLLLHNLVPTTPSGSPFAAVTAGTPSTPGALVTSDVAARAHAAAAALGLAPPVMGAGMVGGGALVAGGMSSAEAAMLAARRAAEALRLAGHATATHFSEEVRISPGGVRHGIARGPAGSRMRRSL